VKNLYKYSIVLPIYNEAENLPQLFREIETVMTSLQQSYEVICVDDGSRDGSAEYIHTFSLEREHYRLIRFDGNFGQSAALAAGFEAAAGEFIITMDSDLQNDPGDISKMVPHLENYDMVTGWRKTRRDTWLKRVSSKIANGIRNSLSRETIQDTGCSLKIMRASCLKRIKMYRGMHRFLPTLMKMEGASVVEIPVSHRSRIAGSSHYGTWDRAFSGLRDLLAVRWMQDRFIHYKIKED